MDQILESLSVLVIPLFEEEGKLDTWGSILWCVFLAVVLVFISVLRQNATLGKAVRLLREKNATSAETALPLSQLGKVPATAYKGSETLFGKVEKDGNCFLYLPEKNEKKADALLKTASAPLWLMLLELLGFYLVLMVLYHLLPWIFSAL